MFRSFYVYNVRNDFVSFFYDDYIIYLNIFVGNFFCVVKIGVVNGCICEEDRF